MGFDVKTLYLINVAVLFMSTAAAYFFWRQYRDSVWLLRWALATAMGGVAFLAMMYFGPAPPLAIGAPAVVLLVAAYALAWETMRLFNGRPPAARQVAWFVLGFAAFYGTAISLGADFTQRASAASAALAILATLGAWEAVRVTNEGQLRSRVAMAVVFAAMALALLARAMLPWIDPSGSTAQSYYDPLQGLAPLVNSVAVIYLSIGFIAMANERSSGRHLKLAQTDELTGLPNRRYFLDQAGHLARRAQRDSRPSAVLMMDLDNFSSINEQFGHAGGDEALMAFACLLRTRMRASDVVARHGGEEFCAFLSGVDAIEAARIAEAVRARIAAQPIDIRGQPHKMTVSIGVASLSGNDVLAALQMADEALYQAKAQGRDRVVMHSPTAARSSSPARCRSAA